MTTRKPKHAPCRRKNSTPDVIVFQSAPRLYTHIHIMLEVATGTTPLEFRLVQSNRGALTKEERKHGF
jgi:hypothetical protein